MNIHTLIITYGTSRGRDTYGYTLVTLRENGTKKASTCGGGYDMRGTVFADWLQQVYQERLMELGEAGKFPRVVWNGALDNKECAYGDIPASEKKERSFLYGGRYYSKGARVGIYNRQGDCTGHKAVTPYVSLDGGCGFSSIQRIAEACGLEVRTASASKTVDVLTITDMRGR